MEQRPQKKDHHLSSQVDLMEDTSLHHYEEIEVGLGANLVSNNKNQNGSTSGGLKKRSNSDSDLIKILHEAEIELFTTKTTNSKAEDVTFRIYGECEPEQGFYKCHDSIYDIPEVHRIPDLVKAKKAATISKVSLAGFNKTTSSRRLSLDSGKGTSIADTDLDSSFSISLPSLNSSKGQTQIVTSGSKAEDSISEALEHICGTAFTSVSLESLPGYVAKKRGSTPPPPLPPRRRTSCTPPPVPPPSLTKRNIKNNSLQVGVNELDQTQAALHHLSQVSEGLLGLLQSGSCGEPQPRDGFACGLAEAEVTNGSISRAEPEVSVTATPSTPRSMRKRFFGANLRRTRRSTAAVAAPSGLVTPVRLLRGLQQCSTSVSPFMRRKRLPLSHNKKQMATMATSTTSLQRENERNQDSKEEAEKYGMPIIPFATPTISKEATPSIHQNPSLNTATPSNAALSVHKKSAFTPINRRLDFTPLAPPPSTNGWATPTNHNVLEATPLTGYKHCVSCTCSESGHPRNQHVNTNPVEPPKLLKINKSNSHNNNNNQENMLILADYVKMGSAK